MVTLKIQWDIILADVLFGKKPIPPTVPKPEVADIDEPFRVQPSRPALESLFSIIGLAQFREYRLEKVRNVQSFRLSEKISSVDKFE